VAKFRYKAMKEGGRSYEGIAEAPDRFAVYSQIRKEKGTVISVQEVTHELPLSMEALNNLFSTVSLSEKIMFARNLGAMLDAGLPLSRALDVLERQTRNPKLKSTLRALIEDIKKGENLHTALGKFPKIFSKLFVSMVKAGEESGKLVDSFKTISSQMKSSYELRRRIRGALTYPIIILIAMFIIGTLMLIYVVPTLTETFEELGAELPTSTKVIIATSNFLKDYTLIALALFIVLVTLITVAFRTPQLRVGI